MQSRPLRVYSPPPAVVKTPEEEKSKPRRKRRRAPKPPVEKKVELPPDEVFIPKRVVDEPEPPIDVPVDGDWAADLSKEFKRREQERKRRGVGEEE